MSSDPHATRSSKVWSDAALPDLTGRTALVTGATGGLGLRVAEMLASHGARVLIGSRNPARGAEALERVAAAFAASEVVASGSVASGPVASEPVASEPASSGHASSVPASSGRAAAGLVSSAGTSSAAASSAGAPKLVNLDLSDLGSVRAAVAQIRAETGDRLDLLVNNAGVMAPPLTFSADGFELQWATNVLGAAALTWLLLPAIESVAESRVVFVSSDTHRRASLDEEKIRADVRGERYRGFDYYGRTKLADLLLSSQLNRHFRAAGVSTISVAAHPGFAATGIVGNGFAGLPRFAHRIATAAAGVLGQPVSVGALPILYAATAPGVSGGQFFGPTRLFELRGPTGIAKTSASARDADLAATLSRVVSEFTDVPAPS